MPPLAPEVKSYGYQKDGEKHYKNIQITNYRTGKSILENYGEPFFEDDMTLIIPADKDNSPVPGTAISIILDRGAYLSEKSVSVCLKEEYQWPYYVNSKTDKDAQNIEKETLKNSKGSLLSESQETYTTLFAKKIKMNVNVIDPGS